MQKIKISRTLAGIYVHHHMDISYALSELVGAVNYKSCSNLQGLPLSQDSDTINCEISEDTYEQLKENFKQLPSIDAAAEVILWNNYFMGMTL